MLHLNYTKILPTLFPSGKHMALKKLAFDQSVFASFMTCGFFTIINLIEGNSLAKARQDIRDKFWTTMVINWKIWIPGNFVNFTFMPIQYQVFFANMLALIYNAALSFIHNSTVDKLKKR